MRPLEPEDVSIRDRSARSKISRPRFLFLLTYRRALWSLNTCSRFRRFGTADEAREYFARISRRRGSKGGALHARLEKRGPDGRWREVALEAEGGPR